MAGAYDERAWAINVDTPEFFALFSAAETNSTNSFRRHCGLSTSGQESRDVFDRPLLQRARAHTVGATAVEEITLLHYLCCLTPLRKDIIALCVQADPSLLIHPSSIRHDTPAAYAVCCGNLPALHLLVQLSEQHLNNKHTVLHPTKQPGKTVAHFAAAYDKVLVLSYLSQACPELLSRPDNNGLTPLHVAARCCSERSLLYLAQWFASPRSDESLQDQLFHKDQKSNQNVLMMINQRWRSGKILVAMDLAQYLYQVQDQQMALCTTTDTHTRDRTMALYWDTLYLNVWYQRTQQYCSAWLVRKIWASGRKTFMVSPFFVVLFAIALSFVGVFVWPKTYEVVYKGYSSRLLHWLVSTAVLVGSLVKMLCQPVPGIQGSQDKQHLQEAYRRIVLDHPDDHNGSIEATVMASTVAVPTTARTLYSSDVCPFCEVAIRRPKQHAHFPTAHCFTCGVCVEGLDHHCPWTGSCIGQHNIWTFRVFLMATMSTVVSYVRLYSAYRAPMCQKKENVGHTMGGGGGGGGGEIWCIFNGSLVHSIILIFFYVPLFLFAMAIAVTQCRLWWMNTTMVGRARIENGKHVRKMTLCGGTTGIAGGRR